MPNFRFHVSSIVINSSSNFLHLILILVVLAISFSYEFASVVSLESFSFVPENVQLTEAQRAPDHPVCSNHWFLRLSPSHRLRACLVVLKFCRLQISDCINFSVLLILVYFSFTDFYRFWQISRNLYVFIKII